MLLELVRRIRYWWSSRGDSGVEEEMRLHLELRARKLREGGLGAADADATARRGFGNTLVLRERSRDVWVARWLDEWSRDFRAGWRSLRSSPGFTVVALATLALGIGANTAIFQLVDALRLRSLPVASPHELSLVQLADRKGWRGSQEKPWPTLTNPQWEYFRDHQDAFTGALAWFSTRFGLGSEPQPVRGLFVSGNFFQVLGVAPRLGRSFSPEDDRRGCGLPGAVLSHSFWETEFAGDPSIVGRKITLNHNPVAVIGVAGAGFTGLEVGHGFDVAVPICSQATLWTGGNWLDAGAEWWLTVMGRNTAGRSAAAIDERLRALSPRLFNATLSPQYPSRDAADYRKMVVRAMPGGAGVSDLRQPYQDPLVVLLAGTGVVLLLACVNLGNMILARASARAHEFALRLAIGASRGRLLRQLMVENGLLAVGGALAGLVVANLLSASLVAFLGSENNRLWFDLRPDGRLIGFCAMVTTVCCLAFGLLPAWRATRADSADALKSSGRSTTRSGATLRQALMVVQVALSLVLVFGALLFSRTLGNVMAVDAGFQSAGVFTAWIDYSRMNVPLAARQSFRRELLETIRAVPGVASAAETSVVPLSGNGGGSDIWLEELPRDRAVEARSHHMSDGYLDAMGMRLLAGRDFNRSDTVGSPRVALVNRSLAEAFGLGANPIGRRFRKEANPWEPETTYEIVGLVNDSKYFSLKEPDRPIAYYSTTQESDPEGNVQLVIRPRADGINLGAVVRAALKPRYPSIGMNFRRLDTTIHEGLLSERLLAAVSGFIGILAAIIAAVGLYGVVSYLVVRRTKEIGIRMALGARKSDIIRIVVSRATLLVSVGVGLGALAGVAAARAARSMLFGLEPYDPSTLVFGIAALVAITLAASVVPAWRAMRLDVLAALRRE